MTWLMLALLQAPTLEEARSVPIDDKGCILLKVSQTGKYLVVGRTEKLEIRSAEDLKLLKEVTLPWTAVGFEEDDAHLVVVNKELVRIRAADWSEVARGPLEKARLRGPTGGAWLVPGQAWVESTGSVLYRTKDGGISRGEWLDGKVVCTAFKIQDGPLRDVEGIIGFSDATPILLLGGMVAGILFRQDISCLISSSKPFFGGHCLNTAVIVGDDFESMYSPTTWKLLRKRTDIEAGEGLNRWIVVSKEGRRTSAAIDSKSERVFVSGEKGLWSWSPHDIEKIQRYGAVKAPCRQIAIDVQHRLLFSVEPDQLRCWSLKD